MTPARVRRGSRQGARVSEQKPDDPAAPQGEREAQDREHDRRTGENARGHTDDDSGVHKAVEDTHRRGMDFWLYYTGHHYGEESRNIVSETFDGVKFLDLPKVKYSLELMKTSCFSKPVI